MNRLTLSAAAGALIFVIGGGLYLLYRFIGEAVIWLALAALATFAIVYLVDWLSEAVRRAEQRSK